jgi:hypothetical protein
MRASYAALPAALLVAVVLVSGCTTPYDGSPPKVDQSRIDNVTASARAWLAGPEGQSVFSGGILAAPIPAFTMNRTVDHWVIPVKYADGKYMGYMISVTDSFERPPNGVSRYPDPRIHLFSMDSSEAYDKIFNESIYTTDQIKEPYLSVIEGFGYHWTCEIVVSGKFVTKKSIPISIIDPHNDDTPIR